MIDYLNKWLQIDPVAILRQILSNRAIQEQIEEWNRQQLLDGKNSLDVKLSDIGGGYSDFTLSLHPEKVRDKVTLFDSGEFHQSITVKLDGDLFSIDANPIKTDDSGRTTNLFEEWGEDIIGINEEKFNIFIEELGELLIIEICKKVQVD